MKKVCISVLFSGKNYTADKNFTRPSRQISTMDASIYWLYCSHSNEGSKLVGPHFLTKCKIVQQTIIILEEGGESPQERLEDDSTISIDIILEKGGEATSHKMREDHGCRHMIGNITGRRLPYEVDRAPT